MYNDFLLIIPAYNEARVIREVICGFKGVGFENIVLVDDGSQDTTAEIAESTGAKVLKHVVNIGVGGATSTGFEYAKKTSGYKYVITADADGQHLPRDLQKIAAALINHEKETVVIGSRIKHMRSKNMLRYIVNQFSNWLTYLVCGLYISDTQSGLRGYTMDVIKKIDIKSSGYEVCSELVVEYSKLNINIIEIPITSVYTEYSLSKGQALNNMLNMVTKVVRLN